jgi:hypothetical protein
MFICAKRHAEDLDDHAAFFGEAEQKEAAE